MQNYYMTVVMAVDKRCAASGRALQAESAASEIQRVKKYIRRKLCNIQQMHAQKTMVMKRINSNFGEDKFLLMKERPVSAPRRKVPACPTIKTEFNNYNRPLRSAKSLQVTNTLA